MFQIVGWVRRGCGKRRRTEVDKKVSRSSFVAELTRCGGVPCPRNRLSHRFRRTCFVCRKMRFIICMIRTLQHRPAIRKLVQYEYTAGVPTQHWHQFGDMSQLLTSMFDSCRSWQAQSASLHGPAKAKMEEGQILCWNDRLVQKHRFFLICVCSLICQSKVFWYKMAVVALLVQCSAVRVQLDELRACFKLLFSTSESTSCCFCPLFWTA